jgi:hypothetical protein
MLQHRGQDSAGMVTTDWSRFVEKKENGLVKDVFHNKKIMDNLPGNVGIGHVRYPTAGTSSALEAQPFFVNSPLGKQKRPCSALLHSHLLFCFFTLYLLSEKERKEYKRRNDDYVD